MYMYAFVYLRIAHYLKEGNYMAGGYEYEGDFLSRSILCTS